MADVTIRLNTNERNELIRILNEELGDTRVEMHRTHTPAFRENVKSEEDLLRGILLKLSAQNVPPVAAR